ncbi:MAG TPA: DNA repair protein RecN [Rhodospirillaceae bacterium]|nr:DNA repair protein RecN [Rhodospirillaceae bacterium]
MLTLLHIKNVVLIDQMSLDFRAGLSALTGETGAGKSILLDSLGLALGARADAGLVRKGTDQAVVSAEFHLDDDHPVFSVIQEQGIVAQSPLILRRILGSDGRSRAYINDEPVSISFLKEVGEALVDIHGQFETYGLLNPATHREMLDLYAGHMSVLRDMAAAYQVVKMHETALAEAKDAASRAAENEAYLRACVAELEKLDPQEGEEAELLERRKALQNRESILETLGFAVEALGGEQGADMQIGQVMRTLSRQMDKIGAEKLESIQESLDRAATEVQDACRQLESLQYEWSGEGYRLEDIEDRLYALRGAARKHGCLCDDLPRLRTEMGDKLKLVDYQDHIIADLEKIIRASREDYKKIAEKLHDRRMAAGLKIDKAVNAELKPLKLERAVFETSIVINGNENTWTSFGFDTVQFRVSTNAGSDFGPLNKIASGGEMARFMLALKVVLAEAAKIQGVYVFDEIDTGIGGATASAVGARLEKLATSHQVMVVTHSPQVASRAASHWVVSKATGGTRVTALDKSAREEEIARMLSGAEITAEARAAASKLLEAC